MRQMSMATNDYRLGHTRVSTIKQSVYQLINAPTPRGQPDLRRPADDVEVEVSVIHRM